LDREGWSGQAVEVVELARRDPNERWRCGLETRHERGVNPGGAAHERHSGDEHGGEPGNP
jgi:hypothetical protein